MRSRLITLFALVLGVIGATAAAPATPGDGGDRVDVIVVLHDSADAREAARDAARSHKADVSQVYRHALQGYAASVPQGRLRALQRDARVDYVEVDRQVSIQATQQVPTGITRVFAAGNQALDIDATDDFRVDVDVAVIDTGVDLQHPDLDVVGGVTCAESGGGPPWQRSVNCSSGGDDDHYHGTHVAGTIGAIDNGDGVVGVAPGARIWAVKVLSSSGSGSESMVVAGIDWVAANADTIEVANMSLGGAGHSQAEYDAIQGAVDKGVAFAVAAGNDDADAGDYSPAAFDNVLTVSALADFDGLAGGGATPTCRSDVDDTLADFSNWGPAVDLAAPGVCILSTYPLDYGDGSGLGTISGTSMASPHAAGALALLASSNNPGSAADVHGLYDQVVAAGNLDWTDDSGDGSKERLLDLSNSTLFTPTMVAGSDTGGTTDPEPEPDPEPSADITLSVNAYKVKGDQHADLTWSKATSTHVDVYLDGSLLVTTANDGAYTHSTGQKGGGSATFQVCEAGTATCSAAVTASW